MKIFKDNKKQLNINPLVVYFIMTPEEKEQHARDIERLNRSKTMNHNLFEFNTVVRARYNNNVLTKGLIKDMEENNVIVKLFGNDDERFFYAFETVEFMEGIFENQIESFLYDVCKLNVKNLKSEKKRLGCYPSKERKEAVEILLKSFTEVVNDFGFDKVHAIASRWSSVSCSPVSNCNASKIPPGIKDDIRYAMGSEEGRKKEDAKKRLIAMIEGWFDAPSSGYSKKVLTGAVDNTKSETLEEDNYTRHPSSQVPTISVEIKKITVLNRKDGSRRENYGFVYNIDGEIVEMYIGGTEPAMIYACTLLKQYTGARFYLDDLRIRKGELSRFNPNTPERKYLNATLEWIRQIYKVFVPSAAKDFPEWYASLFNFLDKSPGHPIYQGKSACNSKISKTLKEYRKAIYFCTLQVREDSKGKFYEVDLPSSESIKLSDELLKLVPESPVTQAHARPENEYSK
ncbi:MAG: hypothetical protein IKX59_08840 [Bacteroidales bacterium]|nr:hypothetical protein [Bacteroidales bacterium]